MCLAIPGKIIEIKKKTAIVDFLGVTREASTEFLDDVKVGEYIIVHAGCALQKLDEEEALKSIELFEELSKI